MMLRVERTLLSIFTRKHTGSKLEIVVKILEIVATSYKRQLVIE